MHHHFRTEITIDKYPFEIDTQQALLWIGSCFAETMGAKLQEAKFPVVVNPYGTVFNPLSIFKQIQDTLTLQAPQEDKYLCHEAVWYHYDYHSGLRALQKNELTAQIANLQTTTKAYLLNCDYLIITFGTAWVYQLNANQQYVANCHKQAGHLFSKHILEVKEIKEEFSKMYQTLRQLRPHLKILLTLSPVRHLKDTLPLNSVSKAVLRLAIHQLCEALEDVFYFPAYELVIDDLRDYRFFGEDMLHPSPQAQSYVWEKFQATCLSTSAKDWLKSWADISKALAHRPFNPNSAAHQQFLQKTLAKIHQFHPHIDLSQEIALLATQLLKE